MKKWVSSLSIMFALLVSPVAGAKALDQIERKITILLNCAVITASAEGGDLKHEEYVIAAAYLAADKGKSLEWLKERVAGASDTAYSFSGKEGAARQCIETLRGLKM